MQEDKSKGPGWLRLFKGRRPSPSVAQPNQAETPLGETTGIRFMVGFLRKDRAALAGGVGLIIFLGWATIEGIMQMISGYMKNQALSYAILPSNPFVINFHFSLGAPTLANFPAGVFGYDYEGASIFSEILYALPRDALAAIVVVASAIVIGMLLGISAGYAGGWADEILMRVTDAFLAFPAILFAIALSLFLGNGYATVLVALVVVWWPIYARFFRAQALTLKARGYVEASKLSGLGAFRIMVRHIFPNSVDPIIAIATLDFGNVILTYSTLAFLGIGLQVGVPELGSMTALGLAFLPGKWWYALFPGLAIMVIVVCFSIIGDRLQDLVGGRLSY